MFLWKIVRMAEKYFPHHSAALPFKILKKNGASGNKVFLIQFFMLISNLKSEFQCLRQVFFKLIFKDFFNFWCQITSYLFFQPPLIFNPTLTEICRFIKCFRSYSDTVLPSHSKFWKKMARLEIRWFLYSFSRWFQIRSQNFKICVMFF